MATQAIEQVPAAEGAADAATATGKGGKRTVLIMAVAGIAAGAAAGLFGVGPILAKRRAAAPPKHTAEAQSAAVVHAIENLVLNPAGSGGTRFLMVTATFELKDAAAEELMKAREAEVRDRILGLLGKKTIDELTDIAKRDEIKLEVLAAVSPVFPKGSVLKVFFPQFVIQ
jgi:flagellar protein FliL